MNKIYAVLKGKFFVGLKVVLLGVMMMEGVESWGQATLPLSRTAWGSAPTGWTDNGTNRTTTFACSGSDGGSMQAAGKYYKVFFNSSPDKLNYSLKGSNPSTGSFKVQESVDGITWTDVQVFTTISGTTCLSQSNIQLLATSRYLQFILITRTSGNVDIDDVSITVPSCTPPTAQAAFTSFANISTSQADINFTAGTAGIGRLIVAAAAPSITGSPSSGTSYTTGLTTNFSTTTPTIATGEKVIYKSSGTSTTVTGLSPETQYAIKIFEHNTSDCYLTTGTGNTGSFYTLSNEPSAQAASLSCNASAYNQIDLTFPSVTASGITNADGYIILQKIGSAPTGLPSDAASYTVGATVGDATVAAIVSSASATTQSITGLSASTNYYYTLIPYNALGTGTIAATYNYLTTGSIPGSNCTTPLTPPGITVSTATLTGFAYVQSAGPSASQTYNVSGTNLTPASGNINIAASTNFEVSTDNSTFSSGSVNIGYTGGALAATSVYVRLKAGLSVGSYNSEIIANTGGGATAKNVTVSGTVSTSSTSNIIEDGDASFYVPNTVNIPYTTWQSASISNTGSGANGSIGVFRFKIQDGGASSPDADALPTIVTGITFNYTGTASTIRTAALFSGSAKVADVTTVNANSLVFSSLTDPLFTVADNGSQVLTLRVTFNTTATDNDKLVYSVGSATSAAAGTSSQFGTISATSDNNTGNDRNRIEVTADRLTFVQGPSNATNGIAMTPAVTVKATDLNSNIDLDFSTSISLACSVPAALASGSGPIVPVSGISTFSSIIHSTDGAYTMTASAGGVTSTAASSNYIISSVVGGTWRTASGSAGDTWSSTATSSTVTWERFVSGSWVLQALPTQPPTSGSANTVIIRHNVTLAGTNTHKDIIIANGGTLNTSTVTATFGSLLVQTGGTFNRQGGAIFDVTGTLEVEDGATFTFKQTNQNSRSSGIWAGTEKFHKNSNFEIVYSDNTTLTILESANDVSLYTDGTSTACFGNIIINCGTGSMQLIPSGFGTSGSSKQLTHQDLIFRSNSDNKFAVGAFNAIIGRDLIIESGYNQNTTLVSTGNTATMTVQGNFTNSSANNFTLANNAAANVTFNVNGDISSTGSGSLNLNFTNGGISATNLKGDLTISAASLLLASSTTAATTTFNFTGTGDGLTAATTQTIDIASTGATRNQYTDFNVSSGAYVQLINRNFELGKSGTVTVKTGGTLDFNFAGTTPLNITNYSTTPGFSSAQGSTLKISSVDGISNTSGTTGNVQLTSATNLSYNQLATFWYIGKANQQTGTGLTTGSSGKIVYVNLLDNTKTLTLTNNIGISNATTLDALGGKLEIQKGIVLGTPTGDFSGGGRLVMSDGEYRISTITAIPLTLYLPQLINYGNYSLTGGTVHLNGANATQILSGTPNYYKVAFSGSNTLGTDYKGISSATTVANAISIAETAIVDVKSSSLGASGSPSFTMTETSRYITDGSGTKPDAGGTYSLSAGTTIEFANNSGAGVVRLGSPAIDYANVIVSGTNVSNTSITTGIKFLSGGTFTIKTGATFKLLNSAGFSNAGGSNATALSNLSPSNPAVTLETGSNVDYAGAAQTITNVTGYQNLILSGSGAKTAPSGTLIINGDFSKTSTATFTHNSGTVAFPGTAAQAYNSVPSITDFYNVTTSNATGLTINNNLSIENELALTGSAKLKLAAGDITLKSSATKTASFAVMPITASITYTGSGLFSVERFINASRKWRFLAVNTITAQSINAAWQEGQAANANGNPGYGAIITDASATAPGVNGFDQSSFTPSMKYFNPTINDYVGVTNTSGNISSHDAYMTFVRGDRTCTPGNALTATTVLRTKGALRVGDTTYTILNAGDFAAIGNPYASRVSISSLPMAGLQAFIYVWDPKIAGANSLGGFQTLQKSGGVWQFPISLGGSYPAGINVVMDSIESGQAFFVRAQSAGASLTFTEGSKAAGSHDVNFTSGNPASVIALLKNAAGESIDAAVVQYDDQNSNSVDYNDALKMANTAENVSIKSSSLLSVEQRKTITADDTVHVNVTGYKLGNYQWTFKLVNMDAPGLTGFVKDNFLNTLSPLNMAGDNNISFTISSAAGSYAADRFSIVFKPSAVVAVTLSTISAQRQSDKTIKVSWKAESEAGINRYEIQHSENGTTFSALGMQAPSNNAGGNVAYAYSDAQPYAGINYYRIKAESISGEVKYTAVVKVAPADDKALFSVNPNPVKDKTIHLQTAAQPAGDYRVQIVNNAGQVIYKGAVAVSGSAFVKDIILPANTAAGNYKLSVTGTAGKITTQNIVIE
jgi:hypothetical protein